MIHAGDPYEVTAFINAAENGHIDVLKYLVSLEEDPKERSNMIHADVDEAFINAAENGHVDVLKYLVSLEEDSQERSNMIHADRDLYGDGAFRSAAGNGHIDVLKYLVSLAENPQARSNMIHVGDPYEVTAFINAAENGHIDLLKYLVSLEEDSQERSNMIHKEDDDGLTAFINAAQNGHIAILEYLVSLEENTETKSNMIHALNDGAFGSAANNSHTDILKYLVVSDPFYKWPDDEDITNLNYYKNIDIKSLCKASTLCKNLFPTNSEIVKNNKDYISLFVDLQKNLQDKIIKYIAQVKDKPLNCIRIKSVIKACTYDSSNYSGGFKGFTYRYESALEKLGAMVVSDSESIFEELGASQNSVFDSE